MLLLQRIAFLAETGLNTDAATGNTTITNVLGWAGGIIGGIIALFLMWSILMEAKNLIKGEGSSSVWKLVGKSLVFILMIGLVFLSINYLALGKKAGNVAGGAVSTIESELPNLGK